MTIGKLTLLSTLLCAALGHASADADYVPPEYRLRLYHTHTNQRIDAVYRRGDTYIASELKNLQDFLRDYRTGDVRDFDPRLFDLLHDLSASLKPEAEIEIVSAYRSPATNEYLRRTSSGVASHSLHMRGEAIDIRIRGVATATLRDAALRLNRGGVGYYPGLQFVHVDVGRVRRW